VGKRRAKKGKEKRKAADAAIGIPRES